MKYQQPATQMVSTSHARRDWAIERAKKIQLRDKKKTANISAVWNEGIEALQSCLEIFGDGWRDHLQVQSEPLWAKEHLEILLDKISNLGTITPEQKEVLTEEIEMSFDGMLE